MKKVYLNKNGNEQSSNIASNRDIKQVKWKIKVHKMKASKTKQYKSMKKHSQKFYRAIN